MIDRPIDAVGKCDRCLGHKASLGLLINENGPVGRLPSRHHCNHSEPRLLSGAAREAVGYAPRNWVHKKIPGCATE